MDFGAERIDVFIFAFVCFVTEEARTEIIVRITFPVNQTFLCLYYYMRNFYNLIGLEQLYFGII